MGQRLQSKVAIITGSASGRGAAEARLFAAEGASVVLEDVARDAGRRPRRRAPQRGDLRRARRRGRGGLGRGRLHGALALRSRARAREQRGHLRSRLLAATTPESWDRHVAINQRGSFLGMCAVAGPMTEGGGGSIVNTSSIVDLRGAPGMFAYLAIKWALRAMTKAAALELAPRGSA